DDHKVTEVLEYLRESGYVYDKDGATWLRSTDFGDDKDRVLIKQDGSYTYLTPDIAYHKNKYDRGYDQIVNVGGVDHHGYMSRMKGAMQWRGLPVDKIDVKII